MKLKHIYLIVLGLVLGGLLVRFGAAAVTGAAVPLLKIILPLAAAYFGVRLLRAKLQQLGDPQEQPRRAEAIDLCPKCGEVMTSGHCCPPSDR